MDALFDEIIARLVKAQGAVREEVEEQEHQLGPSRAALRQLGQAIRSLAQQTDSLLLLMAERNAPEPLLAQVEDLFDVFHEAGDRLDRLMARLGPKVRAGGRA